MIPYFEQPSLEVGPLTFHAFGVLLAAGVLSAVELFQHRAARVGLDTRLSGRLTLWVLIPGFLGAHLADRLLYDFDETWSNPVSLLFLWEGISSYGGWFGGMIGGFLFLRRQKLGVEAWRYLDALAYALPVGWFLGRLGCFVAYDHVGTPTDFFLGQTYRDGIVRHNLGLEEALYWVVLILVMPVLGRKPRPPGFLVGMLAVLYAPARFLLDFLRIEEERHLGLLVSQYASVLLFLFGLWVLLRTRGKENTASGPRGAAFRD